MNNIFLITFFRMCTMAALACGGALLYRRRIIPESTPNVISALIVNLFLPCYVVYTFATGIAMDMLRAELPFLLIGLGVTAAVIAVVHVLARAFRLPRASYALWMFCLVVPNYSYIGFPLVESVFGQQALIHAIVFTLPMGIFSFTAGIRLFNPNPEKFSLRSFLNPMILSVAGGLALGLLSVPLPTFLSSALSLAGNCMGPCAMLLVGIMLSKVPPRTLIANRGNYLIVFLRLIVIPLLALLVCRLVGASEDIVRCTVTILGLPVGLNSIVYARLYTGDEDNAAPCVCLASLLSVITLPLLVSLL